MVAHSVLPSKCRSTVIPIFISRDVHMCAAGAYDPVDVAKVFQPVNLPGSCKAGFTTSSQRFRLVPATPEAVGPGTYVQQSTLLKQSFNVTLDDTH